MTKVFGLVRPPDHNGGANRRGDHGKARDPRLRSEVCTPAFACPIQDACGLRLMVGDVPGKEPLQVPFVEGKHMVVQLAATAPHPTLGDTIGQSRQLHRMATMSTLAFT